MSEGCEVSSQGRITFKSSCSLKNISKYITFVTLSVCVCELCWVCICVHVKCIPYVYDICIWYVIHVYVCVHLCSVHVCLYEHVCFCGVCVCRVQRRTLGAICCSPLCRETVSLTDLELTGFW